jgi:hypothetical protein
MKCVEEGHQRTVVGLVYQTHSSQLPKTEAQSQRQEAKLLCTKALSCMLTLLRLKVGSILRVETYSGSLASPSVLADTPFA